MSSARSRRPRYPEFRISIEKSFESWPALKIALENGQGGQKGREIAIWMIGAVEDYFYLNDDLMGDEVSEFIGTLLNQELDTLVEDNSLEEMGDRLCNYFNLCTSNRLEELHNQLVALESVSSKPVVASQAPPVNEEAEESSSGDDE